MECDLISHDNGKGKNNFFYFDRQRQARILMHKKNQVKKPQVYKEYTKYDLTYTKNKQHLPSKKERPKEYTKEFS